MAPGDWLPDPGLTHAVDGSWAKDQEERKTFVLDGPPFSAVRRHVWVGTSLQTSREDLCKVMDVVVPSGTDLAGLLEQLAKLFQTVKAANVQFRDSTNKSIIDGAGMMREYAKKAGGTTASSYYALLLSEITAYNQAKAKQPPDSKRMSEEREAIKEACASLVPLADKLQTDCAELRAQLTKFRSSIYDHGISLNALLEDFRRQLGKSDVRYLEDVIKPLQTASLHQRSEFENDAIAAKLAVKWALLFFYSALPLMAVKDAGPRSAAIRAVVEATDDTTKSAGKEIRTALRIGTYVQQMTLETQAVADMLQEVETIFRGLEAAWKRAQAELKSLQDSAAHGDVPQSTYDDAAIKQVIDGWNEMAALVQTFEEGAFLEGEAMSLESWLAKTA